MGCVAATFDALVVGAGPAGTAAAIELGRAGVRVLLCERGVVPRHRLCGEFLSPDALVDLEALGLDAEARGAVPLRSIRVTSGDLLSESSFVTPGLGLSRDILDHRLVLLARESGARVETRTPVVGLRGDLAHGFEADLGGGDARTVRARLVIGAFGKQTPAFASRRPLDPKRSHVALKMHFVADEEMPPRVELHALAGGYVGLAPVGGRIFNVCWVARGEIVRGMRVRGAESVFFEMARTVRVGSKPLAEIERTQDRVLGESGMRFGEVHPTGREILLAGDAASLPHPVCGDGIAMALRAGRLAASCALGFLRGRVDGADLVRAYARAWRREFESRIGWSRVLHAALERPRCMQVLLRFLSLVPPTLPYLVRKTRGRPQGAVSVDRFGV